MSRMAPQSQKKRKLEEAVKGRTSRPKKKIRKQQDYHSSEDEESQGSASDTGFAPVNLQDSDEDTQKGTKANSQPLGTRNPKPEPKPSKSPVEDASENDDTGSSVSSNNSDSSDPDVDAAPSKKKSTTKRNDPSAFSTSITKILSTKLPQSARHDPLLSRSSAAHSQATTLSQSRLEARAKAQLRAQRKADLNRNRVTDVLGLESGNAGEVAEEEKRLRKIAQRGVVKLFNAVRAAQVRSEEALREEREKGTVGRKDREEKAKEMSKQGFLELIGGKRERRKAVEEA